jgi:predicted enzyme related to lactoylglutathione lyase
VPAGRGLVAAWLERGEQITLHSGRFDQGVACRSVSTTTSEPKRIKNRVHVDLRCDDADAEAARLVALGARIALQQENNDLIVLSDPEGNEFCLLRQ